MYGHVCETGGRREVLSPRPLKRFTFKDDLNLKIDFVRAVKLHAEWVEDFARDRRSTIDKQDRRKQKQRKIVLRTGTTIRGRLAIYSLDSSKG